MIEDLAKHLVLGALLEDVARRFGTYDLLAHWQQGEFHHDVVLSVPSPDFGVLVVSTNCNGGVKEVLAFDSIPDRRALWAERCGEESEKTLPPLRGSARTVHWFDPCELLGEDARSELRPEFRRRQEGGGWESTVGTGCKPRV